MSEKNLLELCGKSSITSPTFMEVTINETSHDVATWGREYPAWHGIVAIEGLNKKDFKDNEYVHHVQTLVDCRIINKGEELSKEMPKNFIYKPANSLYLTPESFTVKAVLTTTPELTAEHKKLLSEVEMEIKAAVYPEFDAPAQPLYEGQISYKEWKEKYADAEKTIRRNADRAYEHPLVEHTYIIKGMESTDDAEKWILQNHPEEYCGMFCQSSTGNFSASEALQFADDKSYLATFKQREDYTRRCAKALGVEVGEFKYPKIQRENVKGWQPERDSKTKVKSSDKEKNIGDER